MKKKRDILPYLTAACILALIGMILALIYGGSGATEFTPPPFEAAAVQGTPEVPEELGYSSPYAEGMSYRFSVCGNVVMDGSEAVVYLTNPAENEVWLKLRILDENGNRLGETGLIKPGEYVKAVFLEKPLEAGTKIRLKIMGYEPETYRSAGAIVMNTAIGNALQ